ncbi:MAG: hypothetical protein HOB84_12590 [Candidatus Marinimicrobia bacterium]|nr:hypothetical protein [Candidatus Neomarinimicrobiota bacterium]MBT4360301.1 hypothetical protein [Candidatus Neomarinimicrobiota bacterium]MBT4715600.1 hypothetical protein [Candidatus Neomarinimicrobiota bacterium]MBT4946761.1 hypothetical protein [Candidatus Neomarinimicrobiota bacterium]MBT5269252.1 hypothetical protein [Candidatus Neomarinimicrobiota bacterium]
MTIKVEVLFSEGCLRTPLTIERVQEVSQKMGVPIDLTTVQIDTYDEIMEWNFMGSPTVRVNGVDIDPSARGDSLAGFT